MVDLFYLMIPHCKASDGRAFTVNHDEISRAAMLSVVAVWIVYVECEMVVTVWLKTLSCQCIDAFRSLSVSGALFGAELSRVFADGVTFEQDIVLLSLRPEFEYLLLFEDTNVEWCAYSDIVLGDYFFERNGIWPKTETWQ